MKRPSGKHRRYYFKVALIKEKDTKNVQEFLIIVYRKKEHKSSH